jgi:hypothetical protein
MTSTTLYPTAPALMDEPDVREHLLLTHPSWQFPAVFTHYRYVTYATRPAFKSILQERERAIGAATLAAQSILLLLQILEQQGVPVTPASFLWHPPTRTARETQSVLPPYVTVLKTVTVMMSNQFLLWTTIGDSTITRSMMQQVATMFGLPKNAARHSTINPPAINPEEAYALKTGMVSPFLPPGRSTPLSAVVFDGTNVHPFSSFPTTPYIALSLSRYESLLVPYQYLPQVIREYARHAYPQLFIELRAC